MGKNGKLWVIILICLFSLPLLISPAFADVSAEAASNGHAWWFWPIVLFIVTFIMGILAVLGGVGGGVLYVPIISGFFPFIWTLFVVPAFLWPFPEHWQPVPDF